MLIQQGVTAEIVDYDDANSPWRWALVHSAFVAALSLVCLVTWRASARDREAFRSLVESLEEGVLMVDSDGRLVTANPSAERILGMDSERRAGAQRERPDVVVRRARRHAAAGGRAAAADHGRDRCRAGRGAARPAPAGRHDALAVGLDARRREPIARVRTRSWSRSPTSPRSARPLAALERSNLELQQFAYVASHDLSEPLRMVSSYLNLLRRRYRGRLDPDADEFIEYAVDGAARMRALIEGLLAYSRAGRSEETPEPVELGSVTADVLRSLAAAMVEAGAEIEISDLPVVLGVRGQLEQVLQNLMANALKFRADGRARVWVREEDAASGMAQIAVADGGIGIAPSEREHVFEMFGRLHDRETYEGTGIGLAICRKIVERHGGRIWVDEREGGGTVFRFTLPTARAVTAILCGHA